MATTNQQVKDLFNNCDLNISYEAGSLPNIDNAKLLRMATALCTTDPDTFGTTPANVTADQFVVFLYLKLTRFVRDTELQTSRDAVAQPNEW